MALFPKSQRKLLARLKTTVKLLEPLINDYTSVEKLRTLDLKSSPALA
jgi:hypothetical protein